MRAGLAILALLCLIGPDAARSDNGALVRRHHGIDLMAPGGRTPSLDIQILSPSDGLDRIAIALAP